MSYGWGVHRNTGNRQNLRISTNCWRDQCRCQTCGKTAVGDTPEVPENFSGVKKSSGLSLGLWAAAFDPPPQPHPSDLANWGFISLPFWASSFSYLHFCLLLSAVFWGVWHHWCLQESTTHSWLLQQEPVLFLEFIFCFFLFSINFTARLSSSMPALHFPDTEKQIKCQIKKQIQRAKPNLCNKQLAEILNEDLGIFSPHSVNGHWHNDHVQLHHFKLCGWFYTFPCSCN